MEILKTVFIFAMIGLASCDLFDRQFNNAPQEDPMEKALSQFQPVLEQLKKSCDEANKTNIGYELENILKNSFACIKNSFNPENLQRKIEMAARRGNLDEIYAVICQMWPDIHQCLNTFISHSKQCLDRANQTALDNYMGLFDDGNSFFCENNYKHISQFFKEGGPACLKSSEYDIGNCAKPILEDRKSRDNGKMALMYTDQDCSDIHEFRTCAIKSMSNCQSGTPKELADEFLALIQKRVCNSASTFTWFSSFNVILVLCTLLYHKMF